MAPYCLIWGGKVSGADVLARIYPNCERRHRAVFVSLVEAQATGPTSAYDVADGRGKTP